MKAQISRDSYQEKKQYSGVYQQQGRMITDADWNEMVRILKEQMEKTVGASIKSGSPREGGILTEESIENPPPFENTRTEVKIIKQGRVYVDGLCGKIQLQGKIPLIRMSPIKRLFLYQRDFPNNPMGSLKLNQNYVVYIDLWERLVLGLEDQNLLDPALHGADTCVRTETVTQVKFAEIEPGLAEEGAEEWKTPPKKGTAKLRNPEKSDIPVPVFDFNHTCDPSNSDVYRRKNTLFRLEVHRVTGPENDFTLKIKWSTENGSEQHLNDPNLPDFFDNDHIYECYSDVTEKHMGFHPLEGINGWESVKSTLYTKEEYKKNREVADTPAKEMDYIRRWDGCVTLTYDDTHGWKEKTNVAEDEEEKVLKKILPFHTIKLDPDDGVLFFESIDPAFKLDLILNKGGNVNKFIVGDYWLVLIRDRGSAVTAEVLSMEPTGIVHHYMILGTLFLKQHGPLFDRYSLKVTAPQWRRLSFPSLTRLTSDRVLIKDKNGKEISIEDNFVDVDGDEMSGDLTINAKLTINSKVKETDSHTAEFFAENIGENKSHIHYGKKGDWYIRAAASDGKVVIQDKGGNVGIGTDNPTARLTVIKEREDNPSFTNLSEDAALHVDGGLNIAGIHYDSVLPEAEVEDKFPETVDKYIGPLFSITCTKSAINLRKSTLSINEIKITGTEWQANYEGTYDPPGPEPSYPVYSNLKYSSLFIEQDVWVLGQLLVKQKGSGLENGITIKKDNLSPAHSYLTVDDKWHLTREGGKTKGIVIDSDGNVGIRRTPEAQLDINGKIMIRGGNPGPGKSLVCTDGNGTAEWTDANNDNEILVWLGI